LITALKIKMSDLTTLQPCIFLAIDNPSHLDRGLEEVIDQIVVATKDQAAIAAIETHWPSHDATQSRWSQGDGLI